MSAPAECSPVKLQQSDTTGSWNGQVLIRLFPVIKVYARWSACMTTWLRTMTSWPSRRVRWSRCSTRTTVIGGKESWTEGRVCFPATMSNWPPTLTRALSVSTNTRRLDHMKHTNTLSLNTLTHTYTPPRARCGDAVPLSLWPQAALTFHLHHPLGLFDNLPVVHRLWVVSVCLYVVCAWISLFVACHVHTRPSSLCMVPSAWISETLRLQLFLKICTVEFKLTKTEARDLIEFFYTGDTLNNFCESLYSHVK